MPYDVHNQDGQAIAGDLSLDQRLRDNADRHNGYIVDITTNDTVYTSPTYAAAHP